MSAFRWSDTPTPSSCSSLTSVDSDEVERLPTGSVSMSDLGSLYEVDHFGHSRAIPTAMTMPNGIDCDDSDEVLDLVIFIKEVIAHDPIVAWKWRWFVFAHGLADFIIPHDVDSSLLQAFVAFQSTVFYLSWPLTYPVILSDYVVMNAFWPIRFPMHSSEDLVEEQRRLARAITCVIADDSRVARKWNWYIASYDLLHCGFPRYVCLAALRAFTFFLDGAQLACTELHYVTGDVSASRSCGRRAQARREKRQNLVRSVKLGREYLSFDLARRANEELLERMRLPGTPDPTDEGIRKRQWDGQVKKWRAALIRGLQ